MIIVMPIIIKYTRKHIKIIIMIKILYNAIAQKYFRKLIKTVKTCKRHYKQKIKTMMLKNSYNNLKKTQINQIH